MTTPAPSVQDLRSRLFLVTTEAAQIMRVDVRTIRKGIDDGVITAVRIGNAVRIPTAPFLALCGIEAAAPPPARDG